MTDVPDVLVVASVPDLFGDMFGVKVKLDSIKQGSYNSVPACLIKFSIENGISTEPSEICYDFRLCPFDEPELQQEPAARPSIAAYGPAHVTYPANQAKAAESDSARPASVIAYPTPNGVLLILRQGKPAPDRLPAIFNFVMIVVHTQVVVLKVIPSYSDGRRARVFKRSTIRPIHLDLAAEPGDELNITCAQQGDGGCHPTCDDFGLEHMTLDVWKGFIIQDHLRHFDGDTEGNEWVHVPEDV